MPDEPAGAVAIVIVMAVWLVMLISVGALIYGWLT